MSKMTTSINGTSGRRGFVCFFVFSFYIFTCITLTVHKTLVTFIHAHCNISERFVVATTGSGEYNIIIQDRICFN